MTPDFTSRPPTRHHSFNANSSRQSGGSGNWTSKDGKFTLSGYMKNIANEVVMTNIGGEPGTPLTYVSLDAPRTFGFAIRASL